MFLLQNWKGIYLLDDLIVYTHAKNCIIDVSND